MDIKARLVEILQGENHSFAELAKYLHMTEEGLTQELQNKTLEFRYLEAISKVLRIPLYSFFSDGTAKIDYSQKPYFINRLWTGDDGHKSTEELKREIEMLKKIIMLKEEQVKRNEKP
jgi:hypothetical protein